MPPGVVVDRPPTGAVAYCRAARRVRCRHAGRPGRIYRELRALSECGDVGRHRLASPNMPGGKGSHESFAAEVAARLEGPVLRQAQRRTLMRIARRAGIGRFEANLVIAAVQHRCSAAGTVDASAGPVDSGMGGGVRSVAIVLAITLQSLIVWGAWLVFGG